MNLAARPPARKKAEKTGRRARQPASEPRRRSGARGAHFIGAPLCLLLPAAAPRRGRGGARIKTPHKYLKQRRPAFEGVRSLRGKIYGRDDSPPRRRRHPFLLFIPGRLFFRVHHAAPAKSRWICAASRSDVADIVAMSAAACREKGPPRAPPPLCLAAARKRDGAAGSLN